MPPVWRPSPPAGDSFTSATFDPFPEDYVLDVSHALYIHEKWNEALRVTTCASSQVLPVVEIHSAKRAGDLTADPAPGLYRSRSTAVALASIEG